MFLLLAAIINTVQLVVYAVAGRGILSTVSGWGLFQMHHPLGASPSIFFTGPTLSGLIVQLAAECRDGCDGFWEVEGFVPLWRLPTSLI